MKTRLMTSVAVATLGAFRVTSADATDLPAYVPPPPEPAWSWTGPYAGVHAGTVDGDVEGNFELFFNGKFQGDDEAEFDPNGIMGGFQAGYNFQFDSIVLGIEGDVSFGDVDDVLYPTLTDPGGATTPLRVEPQIDWMATIRGRLGWGWDRTLFYVTGGVAFTDLEIAIDAEGFGSGSDKNSYSGWTVGGGVEHALTDSISMKAEYLYADFGKESYSVTDFGESDVGTSLEISGDAKLTTHTFPGRRELAVLTAACFAPITQRVHRATGGHIYCIAQAGCEDPVVHARPRLSAGAAGELPHARAAARRPSPTAWSLDDQPSREVKAQDPRLPSSSA